MVRMAEKPLWGAAAERRMPVTWAPRAWASRAKWLPMSPAPSTSTRAPASVVTGPWSSQVWASWLA